MELESLSESFASLARFYARHYRKEGDSAPSLYVTRVDTGSIIMEIAPMTIVMGGLWVADNAIIAADFSDRLWRGVKAFTRFREPEKPEEMPSKDDAADLREFIRPIVGKGGASLGIKHARYEKNDGEKTTVVEYKFDENEINKAAVNIDEVLRLSESSKPVPKKRSSVETEVMLFLEQANRGPGKEKGRTGDRGIVPDISDKPFPVYFRKSLNDLKEKMTHGEINPLTSSFIVDVHVQYVDDEIRGYIITDVHEVIPTA